MEMCEVYECEDPAVCVFCVESQGVRKLTCPKHRSELEDRCTKQLIPFTIQTIAKLPPTAAELVEGASVELMQHERARYRAIRDIREVKALCGFCQRPIALAEAGDGSPALRIEHAPPECEDFKRAIATLSPPPRYPGLRPAPGGS